MTTVLVVVIWVLAAIAITSIWVAYTTTNKAAHATLVADKAIDIAAEEIAANISECEEFLEAARSSEVSLRALWMTDVAELIHDHVATSNELEQLQHQHIATLRELDELKRNHHLLWERTTILFEDMEKKLSPALTIDWPPAEEITAFWNQR